MSSPDLQLSHALDPIESLEGRVPFSPVRFRTKQERHCLHVGFGISNREIGHETREDFGSRRYSVEHTCSPADWQRNARTRLLPERGPLLSELPMAECQKAALCWRSGELRRRIGRKDGQ